MDILVIGGLLLGFIGARKELSNLLESFKSKLTDFDKYFNLLELISKETVGNYVHKNLNLSEEVHLIELLEKNIFTGETEQAKVNLSKLFHLSPTTIEKIIGEFKSKIIRSNSLELLTALGLNAIEKLNSLEQNVSDLNRKIDKRERDIQETLANLIELLEFIVEEGNLKEAYDRITRINIDDLSGFNSFKTELALIETDTILKMGLSANYKSQIRKLETIENSFKRNFLLLLLHRRNNKSKKFDYQGFEKNTKLDGYTKDIKTTNILIEDTNHELNDNQIEELNAESKKIILKQLLLNLINANKPIRANEIVKKYGDLFQDNESSFYVLINDLNKFHFEHPHKSISKSEYAYLNKLKDKLFQYEAYYKDFDGKIRASYYYNLSITLCRLGNKLAFNYYNFFKDDSKLLLGFIEFCRIAGFINEIIKVIEESSFKDNIEFHSEWINLKFELSQYEDISNIDHKKSNLTKEAKEKILLAKNIIVFETKKDKYIEKDIILFETNRDNVIIYAYLSRFFNLLRKPRLTYKYFKLASSYSAVLTSNEKIHLADTARKLNHNDISKSLSKDLFSENPYGKLLYAEVLRIETNGFKIPSLEANNFFNSIKTSEIVPLDIYRIKIEYLFSQGDIDRAIDISQWLVDNYDDEYDWYDHINMLIENGNFPKARDCIPILEKRTQTPVILLTLAIIDLYTASEAKLEKFAKRYLLAEKKGYLEKRKLSESSLTPLWFYIITNGLYVKPQPEFVKEDVFVRLKNKSIDEIIEICIHSDPNLEIPYSEEYLGCKHIHIDSEVISDLKFKKSVTLRYTDACESSLKQKKEISDDLISILKPLKSREIVGERNYYESLLEVLKEHSQLKYIPMVMEQLERTYDELVIEGNTYIILSIDSIWNYPVRYLSRHFYSHPQKYGMRKVDLNHDPLINILPELEKDQNKNLDITGHYLNGDISLFIFSHSKYEHYLGGILKLLSERNKFFLTGVGVSFPIIETYAISYSSLLILSVFDKLKFLPLEKLVIPESLYLELKKITKSISDSISIEKLSISLEEDFSIKKFVLGPDANLERARKWHEFSESLRGIEKIDTTKFEDEYTPLVRALGKIEVDSIRISNNLEIPLIIDDEFIHKLLRGKNVTNFVPFYFANSSESLFDKLKFLDELSKMGYRYIIFHDFIKNVIEHFLFNEGLLLGASTPFGVFLKILGREFIIQYPTDIGRQLLIGIKSISNNYLCKNSNIIFKEIWKVLPKQIQEKFRFSLTYILPDLQSERNFILSCLEELERN